MDKKAEKLRDLTEVAAFILLLFATPVVTGVVVHRRTGSIPKTVAGVLVALPAAPAAPLFAWSSIKNFRARGVSKPAPFNPELGQPTVADRFLNWLYDCVRESQGAEYTDRNGVYHARPSEATA